MWEAQIEFLSLDSWLQPHPALAVKGIWGASQQMRILSLSLSLTPHQLKTFCDFVCFTLWSSDHTASPLSSRGWYGCTCQTGQKGEKEGRAAAHPAAQPVQLAESSATLLLF